MKPKAARIFPLTAMRSLVENTELSTSMLASSRSTSITRELSIPRTVPTGTAGVEKSGRPRMVRPVTDVGSASSGLTFEPALAFTTASAVVSTGFATHAVTLAYSASTTPTAVTKLSRCSHSAGAGTDENPVSVARPAGAGDAIPANAAWSSLRLRSRASPWPRIVAALPSTESASSSAVHRVRPASLAGVAVTSSGSASVIGISAPSLTQLVGHDGKRDGRGRGDDQGGDLADHRLVDGGGRTSRAYTFSGATIADAVVRDKITVAGISGAGDQGDPQPAPGGHAGWPLATMSSAIYWGTRPSGEITAPVRCHNDRPGVSVALVQRSVRRTVGPRRLRGRDRQVVALALRIQTLSRHGSCSFGDNQHKRR